MNSRPRDLVLVVESENAETHQRAIELAKNLGLSISSLEETENAVRASPQAAADAKLILAVRDEGLELRDSEMRPGRGLHIDFSTLHPKQAAAKGGFSRKQPLARAMGKHSQTILDATAGLGHDAALLACMGFEVTAVERSPVVAALLQDGFRRAMLDPELRAALHDRLKIMHADARDLLSQHNNSFDAVYIDPMFPPKRKHSALAKKEIRLVRQIVGDDDDATELLATARTHCKRVVVKRPTSAPHLHDSPTSSIESKLVRYDVYVS